jgi:hypothetical protein
MELIIKYLGSGKLYKDPRDPIVFLRIVKFADITQIIIPFFKTNPLIGGKKLDFLD